MELLVHLIGAIAVLAYLAVAGFVSFAWSNDDPRTANRFGTLFAIILLLLLYVVSTFF